MKMSVDWLDETASVVAGWGFEHAREEGPEVVDGAVLYTRVVHTLRQGERQVVLEALTYPDGTVRYWCGLDWAGLSSTPYPLDSWKHHADRVELKFQVDPETSMGLSLVLRP